MSDNRDTDPIGLRPIPSEPPISLDPEVLRNILGWMRAVDARLANLESIPHRLEAIEGSIQSLLGSLSTRFDKVEDSIRSQQATCKTHHPTNGFTRL